MDAIVVLVLLAVLFAATGLLALGAKWLFVMAAVIAIATACTVRYGRVPRA